MLPLQTLWLSDNAISSIEGLSTLTNLTELNLARNDITSLGNVLHHISTLRTLNVADNPIGGFNVWGCSLGAFETDL